MSHRYEAYILRDNPESFGLDFDYFEELIDTMKGRPLKEYWEEIGTYQTEDECYDILGQYDEMNLPLIYDNDEGIAYF